MRHYFKVYKRLLILNWSVLTTYRGNFINSAISSTAWGIFSFISTLLLVTKIEAIFDWSKIEIVFLTATYAVFIGIFHMIFSANFDRLAEIIHFGELDTVLTKPLDSQFLVSLWIFSYTHVIRVVIGIGISMYLLMLAKVELTLLSIVVYVLLMIAGLIALYSLWLMVMTITIWHSRLSNLVEVMYNFSGTGRYPKEVIREVSYFAFLVMLPVTLAMNTPAKYVLGKPLNLDALVLIVITIVLFFISRKFWQYALRFYTSANS